MMVGAGFKNTAAAPHTLCIPMPAEHPQLGIQPETGVATRQGTSSAGVQTKKVTGNSGWVEMKGKHLRK